MSNIHATRHPFSAILFIGIAALTLAGCANPQTAASGTGTAHQQAIETASNPEAQKAAAKVDLSVKPASVAQYAGLECKGPMGRGANDDTFSMKGGKLIDSHMWTDHGWQGPVEMVVHVKNDGTATAENSNTGANFVFAVGPTLGKLKAEYLNMNMHSVYDCTPA